MYMTEGKYIAWDPEKNELLKRLRGISFEEVKIYIESGEILDVVEHPNIGKYRGQKIYVLWIHEYVHAVPFVEDEEKVFLKTIYPSRALMKKYH